MTGYASSAEGVRPGYPRIGVVRPELARTRRRNQSAVRLLRRLAVLRAEWADQKVTAPPVRLPERRTGPGVRLFRGARRQVGQGGFESCGEAGLKFWALDWELIEARQRSN